MRYRPLLSCSGASESKGIGRTFDPDYSGHRLRNRRLGEYWPLFNGGLGMGVVGIQQKCCGTAGAALMLAGTDGGIQLVRGACMLTRRHRVGGPDLLHAHVIPGLGRKRRRHVTTLLPPVPSPYCGLYLTPRLMRRTLYALQVPPVRALWRCTARTRGGGAAPCTRSRCKGGEPGRTDGRKGRPAEEEGRPGLAWAGTGTRNSCSVADALG